MWKKLIDWIRQVAAKVFKRDTITEKFGNILVNDAMMIAIEKWMNMYVNICPWLHSNSQSLKLPSSIASEMATNVTLEMQLNVTGSPRADYFSKMLDPFREAIRIQTEYACAHGGIVFKPYVDGKSISIDYVQADDFYPTAFNKGEITGGLFIERKVANETYYTRIEEHGYENEIYVIKNRAYMSKMSESLGQEIDMANVPEWKDIKPVVTIENIPAPLFAYFKIPLGNTVDPKSPLGVSIYAKAEGSIKEADLQFQRLCWEYEAGEMAIDAPDSAFTKNREGQVVLPVGKERLYRTNKLDPKDATAGEIMKTFAPTLRDSNYIAGLNNLLMKIEDMCGLARGTFSDPNEAVMTATQLKTTKQRTYATVTSIQTSLKKAIDGLLVAMDTLATLYNLAPAGTYTTEIKWGDSVVIDSEAERMRDMQEVLNGLMLPWEFRMTWYGEDEATAKAKIAEIDQKQSDDAVMNFKPKVGEGEAG